MHLDKKRRLLNKYQAQMDSILEQVGSSQTPRTPSKSVGKVNRSKKSISSLQKAGQVESSGPNTYDQIILGLEFNIEKWKNKNEQLEARNRCLEAELLRLRKSLGHPEAIGHVLLPS